MPYRTVNLAAGATVAYNLPRITFMLRGGYQQALSIEFVKAPFYAFAMAAYKFNFLNEK